MAAAVEHPRRRDRAPEARLSKSCSGRSLAVVPSALIPTSWRSRSKRSTAILPAKEEKTSAWTKQERKSSRTVLSLVASRCPIICRAKRSASILRRHDLQLLRRRAACHRRKRERDAGLGSGCSCASSAPPVPNTPAETCETVAQAPAPERPIAGGLATPALLAQVLVRQILRSHAALSAVADLRPPWGRSSAFDARRMGRRRLLVARGVARTPMQETVFASDHLFADDTPVPVLDPGRGRTKTGRTLGLRPRAKSHGVGRSRRPRSTCMRRTAKLNVRLRISNTSAAFFMSTAMPGSSRLADKGDVVLAACWSHTRRKFYEVAQATNATDRGRGAAPYRRTLCRRS